MKILLLIYILCLPFTSKSQIDGSWIVINSESLSSGWIRPLDGVIFHFDSKDLQMTNALSEKSYKYSIKIKDKIIYLGDSIFAKISHLSKDSLKLDFDGSMRVLLYPLPEASLNLILDDKELIDNSWIINYGNAQQSIDFLYDHHMSSANSDARLSVTRNEGDWYGGDMEFWNLLNLNSGKLLTLTYGQSTPLVYSIVSYKNDTIRMNSSYLLDDDPVFLIRRKKLNFPEYNATKSMLTSKRWDLYEITDLNKPRDEDLFFESLVMHDTTLIYAKDFLNKRISYQFNNDDTYAIYSGNKLISKGTFHLKMDGKVLVLDSGTSPQDYIQIIRLSDKELVISSSTEFIIEKNNLNYFEIFYYKIKLKN